MTDDLLKRLDLLGRDDQIPICALAAARIRELEAQITAPAVKVKPLVWEVSDQSHGWRADCELMRDFFVTYQIGEKWSAVSQWFGTTYHPTSDAGKAHLDQIRAARILSAIETVPASAVRDAALEEAAMKLDAIARTKSYTDDFLGETTGRNLIDPRKAAAAIRDLKGGAK